MLKQIYKKTNKKIFSLFLLFFFISSSFFLFYGQTNALALLEEYGGAESQIADAMQDGSISDPSGAMGSYINWLVQMAFILGSISAVFLIVIGGIQYITTDSYSKKSEGKTRIQNALGGLLLLITSFVWFNTINPETLNVKLAIAFPGMTNSQDVLRQVQDVLNSDPSLRYDFRGVKNSADECSCTAIEGRRVMKKVWSLGKKQTSEGLKQTFACYCFYDMEDDENPFNYSPEDKKSNEEIEQLMQSAG